MQVLSVVQIWKSKQNYVACVNEKKCLSPSVNGMPYTHGGKYVEKQMAAFYSVNTTAAATTDDINRLKCLVA